MGVSRMTGADYPEGYWERGEGSNYRRYGDDPGWARTVRWLATELGNPTGVKLAEVGSAKGYFLLHAQRTGFNVAGLDISDYAVGKAPAEVKLALTLGNAVDLPWEDDRFDALCSWEFLEHVYEDELDGVLAEMLRVTRPGGLWVHRIGWATAGDPAHVQDDSTHYNEQTPEWWRVKLGSLPLKPRPDLEDSYRAAFDGRDWRDRLAAYEVTK